MSRSEMEKDFYYAQMLGMMREQGRKDNPTTIQLGTMQSSNSVKIADLLLSREDLYIADYLLLENDNSLTKGDIVALQKLDNNMYLILARVVRL